MTACTRTILFTLALMTTSVVGAGVYKYIDENGNVAYGDKPVHGSEKVKIHVTRPPTPESDEFEESEGYNEERAASSDDDSDEPAKDTKYKSLEILTPKPEKVISDRTGSVQIIFLPSPQLGKFDELVINVDGKDISKGRDANLSMSNIPRGRHTVTGRILDANGKTKIRSPSVTFHVQSK